MARFMVVIAHNKISETCKTFIDDQFSDMFKDFSNPKEKIILQDGDLSQNTTIASVHWIYFMLFFFTSCYPDLNSIENMRLKTSVKLLHTTCHKNFMNPPQSSFSILPLLQENVEP